jgi:hypothetical protein
MQQIARSCLIFGLHVHVGIPDREEGIDIMNQARYLLPHLYALSVNSSFWLGQNTGVKAYRHMINSPSRLARSSDAPCSSMKFRISATAKVECSASIVVSKPRSGRKSVTIKCYNRTCGFPVRTHKSLAQRDERWCAIEGSNL